MSFQNSCRFGVPPSINPDQNHTRRIFREADAVCFDVDSTVITDEGLDQLAAFCGKANEVKQITAEAMKGGCDFKEALRMRLRLIRPKQDTVRIFVKKFPPQLTKNIDHLVHLLHERQVDVYLVSGGFHSLIAPVAKCLNIPMENVFANRLKFFVDGEFAGFDESQPTSRSGGKAEVMRRLKARRGYERLVMVGDGATDMEACPPADAFIGFGGNVVRDSVRREAPWYVYEFTTLIKELEEHN